MPVLHVEAQSAELLAASRNGAKHGVDGVHERDGPGRHGVVGTDGRALCAKLRHGEADSARALREPHDIARGLGDVLDVVLHFENEAVGELRVGGSRVDESRTGGEVFEARHLSVETKGNFVGVLFVERETHGNAHPKVLGHFKRVAVAALDPVAVVERDNTDVLEESVVFGKEFFS